MSRENVEAFKRATAATNRRNLEAVLEGLHPEVEWHPALEVLLGGEAAVYRGYEGVRELFRDSYEAWTEIHTEFSEIRDLGDRLVAIGRIRTRGKESGVEAESPLGYLVHFKNGKAIRFWGYLDPKEALEAAGLRE